MSSLDKLLERSVVTPQLPRFSWGFLDSMTAIESYNVSIRSGCPSCFEELMLDHFSSRIWGFSNIDLLRPSQCGDVLSIIYLQLTAE